MRDKSKSKLVKGESCGESPLLDDRKLHELIARRAYELYESRGCEDGHECEDWLEAEKQLLIELEADAGVRPGPLNTIRAA
ncbi:MAG: DUF2934 domain-containing protein [Acidobacteria bacterium]|nr:DUF2934 domain-containing protein [Acidobacteriota bacterium]